MSTSNLTRFLDKIKVDARLQDQLKGVNDPAAFTATLVKLGLAEGYPFTADEVDQTLIKNRKGTTQELSEADLELVAGGRPAATSDGCGAAWTTLFGPC